MKIIVISYSLTGNNKNLAHSIAAAVGGDHYNVSELKTRTTNTIVWDMLFNRSPKVSPPVEMIDRYDLVIFVGPVWMGQVASPLRVYFRYLNNKAIPYVFISLSGGADGGNPKLEAEMIKRVGRKPEVLLDMHITDLLPALPKPDRKMTSAYQVNEQDIEKLTQMATKALGSIMDVETKNVNQKKLETII